MVHPPHLGDRVHDKTAQGRSDGGSDLGRPIPQGPAFVVDGQAGRCQQGEAHEQESPALFRQGMHLTIDGCKTAVGVFHFAILVATNMHRLPSDRGFLERSPKGLHEVQLLLSRVRQEINGRTAGFKAPVLSQATVVEPLVTA